MLTTTRDEKPKTADGRSKGPKMTTQRGSSKGSTISKQAPLSLEDPRTTDGGSESPKITLIDYTPDSTQSETTKGGVISKQAELSLIVVLFVLVISIPGFKP